MGPTPKTECVVHYNEIMHTKHRSYIKRELDDVDGGQVTPRIKIMT